MLGLRLRVKVLVLGLVHLAVRAVCVRFEVVDSMGLPRADEEKHLPGLQDANKNAVADVPVGLCLCLCL